MTHDDDWVSCYINRSNEAYQIILCQHNYCTYLNLEIDLFNNQQKEGFFTCCSTSCTCFIDALGHGCRHMVETLVLTWMLANTFLAVSWLQHAKTCFSLYIADNEAFSAYVKWHFLLYRRHCPCCWYVQLTWQHMDEKIEELDNGVPLAILIFYKTCQIWNNLWLENCFQSKVLSLIYINGNGQIFQLCVYFVWLHKFSYKFVCFECSPPSFSVLFSHFSLWQKWTTNFRK